ncbi:CDGSH iron-sulfur domain-containing protein 3, mitochondrial [Condylostylus longicornis]|uniref:CDGSH iron-sulfur domain-containing protein 3, mitochondrial n=1 Tax=Condylostylus longicornis TaxID=2530218 RepID=UPI00244E33B3|nr:CDGSH iron-sulfur domain-containing protein 3, mitochondrial [Condylostylus longicornis]
MLKLFKFSRYSIKCPNRFYSKEIPKNVLETNQSSQHQENGAIYDKKPFKLNLTEGKMYAWCLCGKSKNQPLCDGTHKNEFLKIKHRPIRFQVEKTGEYWLCNCKQTKHRPFCDGTHKQPEIQAAIK